MNASLLDSPYTAHCNPDVTWVAYYRRKPAASWQIKKKNKEKKTQHCSQVTNILIWFSDKSVRHKLLKEKKSPEYSRHRNKDLEEVNHILTETRCNRKE